MEKELKPLVSVIMPSHNSALYFAESIGSLIKQSYPNWELCVALDNCTDNSKEILAAFQDRRIKVIECKKGSPAGSRNQAISLANGQFLAFLDADDWWCENKLEQSLIFLQQTAADLIWHNEFFFFEKTQTMREVIYRPLPKYFPNLLFSGNRISTSAVVIRVKNTPQEIQFNESRQFYGTEDFLLWGTLAAQGYKINHLNKTLGYYRIRKDSVSANRKQHHYYCENAYRELFRSFGSRLSLVDKLKVIARFAYRRMALYADY